MRDCSASNLDFTARLVGGVLQRTRSMNGFQHLGKVIEAALFDGAANQRGLGGRAVL